MKKLITLLLTVTMMLGMISMTSVSADGTTETQTPVVTAAVRIDGRNGIRFRVQFDDTTALRDVIAEGGNFGAFILSNESFNALSDANDVTHATLEAAGVKAVAGSNYVEEDGKIVVYYTIENFTDKSWYALEIKVVPYIAGQLYMGNTACRSLSDVAFWAVSDPNEMGTYNDDQRSELYKYAQTFAGSSLNEKTMIYYEGFDNTDSLTNLGWSKVSDNEKDKDWDNSSENVLKVKGFYDNSASTRWLIKNSDYMEKAYEADGFTIEYSVKYTTEKSGNSCVGVFFNHNDGTTNASAVYDVVFPRVGGKTLVRRYVANKQTEYVCTNHGDYSVGSFATFYPDETRGNSNAATPNCFATKGDTLVYRVQVSEKYGVTVWVRKADTTEWTKIAYFDFQHDSHCTGIDMSGWFTSTESKGFGLAVPNECNADIDYIAVWSGFGDMPTDTSTDAYTN